MKAGLTQSELGARLSRDRAQIARWETEGQEPSFENLKAVIEACGFVLRVEIVEPDRDPAVDAEVTESLRQGPQQRVQSLLDRLGRDR